MSGLQQVKFPNITIASGQQNSGIITHETAQARQLALGALADLIIYAPAALTGTVNVQVSDDNATWNDLYVAGNLVTIPAGGAASVPVGASPYIRVHSGSAEGSDRAFRVRGQVAL